MASRKFEYECALSGVVVPGDAFYGEDGLEDLPAGWTEVKMSRRVYNPKWILLQQVKNAMVKGLMSQFPLDVQEAQGVAIRIQVEAQFQALENVTPPYFTEVETAYLAAPDTSEEMFEAVNEARELMGFSTLGSDAEDEDREDHEDAEEIANETGAAGQEPSRS